MGVKTAIDRLRKLEFLSRFRMSKNNSDRNRRESEFSVRISDEPIELKQTAPTAYGRYSRTGRRSALRRVLGGGKRESYNDTVMTCVRARACRVTADVAYGFSVDFPDVRRDNHGLSTTSGLRPPQRPRFTRRLMDDIPTP